MTDTTQTQQTSAPEIDPFEQAFQDLVTKGETPVTEAMPNPASAEAVEPVKAAEAAEPAKAAEAAPAAPPAAEPAPATTDFTPAEPAPPAAEPVPAPHLTEDFLTRFAEIIQKGQQPAQQAPVERAPHMPPPPPPFTPDEAQLLNQYDQDFPDISRAEAVRRREEYKVVVSHVFGEFAKALQVRDAQIQMLLERQHMADLQQIEPDYSSDLREQVVSWVNKQPPYLQAAYNHVITSGTPDEVKDLISRFKQASGGGAPAPRTTVTPSVPKPAAELPEAAKKAADALAPVGSKRSAAIVGVPTTFDDAFETFAKSS
jgi:hypothetical protein